MNNKIATAESKATEANTKAEEADRVLAVANRKIVDLEYRNEPRQLTAAQKEQLLAALKMCQPGKVQILYVAGDVEAFAYANQLAEVFKAGQFSVIGPDAEAMDATYVSLGVHMRDRDHLPPWFNTVLAALLQVDGSTKSCRNEHVKEGEGWITVGNKTLSMGPAITIK